MSMTLTTNKKGYVTIVEASGKLTVGVGASTLRQEIRELAKDGFRWIVLNMADVSQADSSGIGALIASRTAVMSAGGDMKLSNLRSRVQRLLLVTGLHEAFDIFEDEQAALDSFQGATLAAGGAELTAPDTQPRYTTMINSGSTPR